MPITTAAEYHGLLKRMANLGSTMVFIATSILMAVSIIGTVLAFSIYRMQDSNASYGTSQSLTLLSSAVSFVFVGLYLLAARRNEPVSKARPPTLPLHGACFIIMRITALLWAATIIVSLWTMYSTAGSQECSGLCLLKRIDTIVSLLAIVAAIAILLGLDNCDEPFKTPSALKIQPRIVCRVSYFDEILERSVSRHSSFDNREVLEQERTVQVVPLRVTRIKTMSTSAATQLLARDFRHTSTSSEDIGQLAKHPFRSSRAYSSHWLGRTERWLQSDCRILSKSGCSITQKSMPSPSPQSLGSSSESSAGGSSSRSCSRGNASPSSSISSYSRRSPLSTMRSVDNPEIPIEPDVHICPPPRDAIAQQQSLLCHTINGGASSIQMAHAKTWRRRTSNVARSVDLRKQTIQSKSIQAGMWVTASEVSNHNSTPPLENVSGKSFLGAYINERRLRSVEDTLDLHSRIIEESIQAAVKYRMQQEQLRREQAIQDDVAAEEACILEGLQIQDEEGQSSLATVSTVERSSEDSPVLPELDLDYNSLCN